MKVDISLADVRAQKNCKQRDKIGGKIKIDISRQLLKKKGRHQPADVKFPTKI